jgi:hypothetical protein
MNAISLLEEDHRKMKKLLSELESTSERGVKTREELFGKAKGHLTVHETGGKVHGREGEHRAPHRGRRERDVRTGSAGVRRG